MLRCLPSSGPPRLRTMTRFVPVHSTREPRQRIRARNDPTRTRAIHCAASMLLSCIAGVKVPCDMLPTIPTRRVRRLQANSACLRITPRSFCNSGGDPVCQHWQIGRLRYLFHNQCHSSRIYGNLSTGSPFRFPSTTPVFSAGDSSYGRSIGMYSWRNPI